MICITDGDLQATIDTACGNNCRSLVYRGHEYIHMPPDWRPPALAGIPLLAPWANRIDGESYLANGWRYFLNSALGNLRYDSNRLPIHGLVLFTNRWKVVRQDASSVASRLEYWREPAWMAQFPFAHAIEITHRVGGGSLEIETSIENLSDEPMPLSIGFHPYFRLGSPRETWRVKIAAREEAVLSPKKIPTGEKKSFEPGWAPLAGKSFDTVFTALTGDEFAIEDGKRHLSIRYGPKYSVAVVYAPPDHDFICFEPLTAPTNAFNSNAGLQHISPGATWRERFLVTPK